MEWRLAACGVVCSWLYVLMTYANRDLCYKGVLICCIDVGAQI